MVSLKPSTDSSEHTKSKNNGLVQYENGFRLFDLDICIRSQWGKPQYQLIQSPTTKDGKQTYLYRILILPLGVTIQVSSKVCLYEK